MLLVDSQPYGDHNGSVRFITACIRRMTEGNVFTLSTISGGGVSHPRSRQGVPYPADWGYSIPGLDEGYPFPGLDPISGLDGGGTPSQVWMGGVLHPRSGWGGYSIPGLDGGVLHPRSGWGVPHLRSGWGWHPIPGLDGGYTILGQPPLSAGWGTPHPGPRSGQGGTPTGTAWHLLSVVLVVQ